jgi:hypothetical protein
VRVPGEPALADHVGLGVTGRCGLIDTSMSRRVQLEPLAPGGGVVSGWRGWCFDPESWDTSDLFIPSGTLAVCVTDDVRRALLDAGVTNCQFERMSEIEWPLA